MTVKFTLTIVLLLLSLYVVYRYDMHEVLMYTICILVGAVTTAAWFNNDSECMRVVTTTLAKAPNDGGASAKAILLHTIVSIIAICTNFIVVAEKETSKKVKITTTIICITILLLCISGIGFKLIFYILCYLYS